MNKKIIAAALAATFAAPFAMADVTIYGFMSGAIESVTVTGATNGINAPAQTRVTDQTSRIGFKGTEDLGNGSAAIWQVENALKDFANGGTGLNGATATFATRNTFVGLSNQTYGAVRMGYYDSAYKRYTTTDVGTDVMANTTAGLDEASKYDGVVDRGDARLANSVSYDSPVWAGFSAGLSYGADETVTDGGSAKQIWSLAGHYVNGPLVIAAGYNYQANSAIKYTAGSGFAMAGNAGTNVSGSSITFAKLAASYKFSTGTYVGANAEHGDTGTYSGVDHTQNDFEVALGQDVGAASFKLAYAKLGGLSNETDSGSWNAHQWVLGATYNLSKSTQLLAYYTQISNGANQNATTNQQIYSANTFSTTTTSPETLYAGSKVSAIGAGVTVNF